MPQSRLIYKKNCVIFIVVLIDTIKNLCNNLIIDGYYCMVIFFIWRFEI